MLRNAELNFSFVWRFRNISSFNNIHNSYDIRFNKNKFKKGLGKKDERLMLPLILKGTGE
ncbi:MAG: hypothetical protein ACP5T9_05855 [Thermoplasmata archaeon]